MSNVTFGQLNCEVDCNELIENGSVAYLIQPPGLSNLHTTVQEGKAPPWEAFGSPHHFYRQEFFPACTSLNHDAGTTPTYNCLVSQIVPSRQNPDLDGYAEGIFQDVFFNGDGFSTYCITITCKNVFCSSGGYGQTTNSQMFLNAGNNFVNHAFSGIESYYDSWPVVFADEEYQEITSFEVDSYDTQVYSVTYVPSSDFTQFVLINAIQIGSEYSQAVLEIENVSITCETTSLSDINVQIAEKNASFSAVNSSSFIYQSYSWDFGDGGTSTDVSPTHKYNDCGVYEVCLDIVDENGCCGHFCDMVVIDMCEDMICSYICHEEVAGETGSADPGPGGSLRCVIGVEYKDALGVTMNLNWGTAYDIYDFSQVALAIEYAFSGAGIQMQVFTLDPREEIQCFKAEPDDYDLPPENLNYTGETFGYFAFGEVEIVMLKGHKKMDINNNCIQNVSASTAPGGFWNNCD